MVMRLHDFGKSPKFIGGKLIQPGSFYDAPATEFVSTDVLGDVGGDETVSGLKPDKIGNEIPVYESITLNQMKEELDSMSVDYSEYAKDKQTLYAFYMEVKKNAGSAE